MIFIATPCYGGMCTVHYHRSTMALQQELVRAGIEVVWSTPWNESLITRARNNQVAEFLKTDMTHLLFIDADIEFSVSDVNHLWNLDKDVSVGAYKMKQDGASLTVWKDGKLRRLEGSDPIKIDYAGTGFMLIKREVIERLIEAHPELAYEEKIYSEKERALMAELRYQADEDFISEEQYEKAIAEMGEVSQIKYAIFDTLIDDRTYLSEDYTFCKRWRDLGGEIWCDPKIKLTHWGSKGYA